MYEYDYVDRPVTRSQLTQLDHEKHSAEQPAWILSKRVVPDTIEFIQVITNPHILLLIKKYFLHPLRL